MVIFTKYSNERSPRFRIRTEILEENGVRTIRKTPSNREAGVHIAQIYERFLWLQSDLAGSGLHINRCEKDGEAVCFPYLEGQTLEEYLDELLERGRTEALTEEIGRYFAMFSEDESLEEFRMTPEFVEVFGKMEFAGGQKCRRISDIDMIFSNVIRTADGPELIDYEWTFDFPVPLAFLRYRCLYYYILGNAKREKLKEAGLYEQFGIDPAMQKQFAAMEQQFQKYMLGSYCPVWKLYDEISDGVIDVLPLTDRESRARVRRSVEVYFDDGRGFGTWNWKKYRIPQEGRVTLQIPLPEGTHCVRLDPSTERCILRIESLRQNGCDLPYTTNGVPARNGDVIFDLPDPQIYFEVTGNTAVEAVFFAEPLEGLSRELILHQHGRLRWMEQTRVWRLYKKLKGKE